MKITEIISETFTYDGHPCAGDCSDHHAGYQYAMQHDVTKRCNTSNAGFNVGCNIALDQLKKGKISKPRIRDDDGMYADSPEYKRMKKLGKKKS